MPWMLPSVVATLSVSIILALVFIYLYLQERQRFLALWTWAWIFYCLRFAFQLTIINKGYSDFWWFANQSSTVISGVLLLCGTIDFSGRPPSRKCAYLAGVCILWIIVSLQLELSFFWLTLPLFSFLGGIYIWTGAVVLKYHHAEGFGRELTGWSFILWGVHKFDYPFLRPIEWLAPWGYLLGAMFQIAVALGLILIYFELIRTKLVDSENRFRRILEDQTELVMRWLPDGTRTFVNDAYCRYFDISREEVLSSSFIPKLTRQQRRELFTHVEELTMDNPVASLDIKLTGGTGSERWIRWTNRGFFDSSGELVEIQSVGHDIDEQRRAEMALRESEQRYRSLFENTYLPMLLINPEDGGIREANLAACKFYGYGRKRLSSMKVQQINTRPDDEVLQLLKQAANSEKNFFQGRHRLASGSVRDVEVVILPIDVGGNTMLNSIIYDITDRKHAESQLALLFTAIEQAAESVIITDAEAHIQFANPAFEKTSGYSRGEILGRNPRFLNSGRHDSEFYRELWGALNDGNSWHGRLINRGRNGELFEEDAVISPVRGESGEIVSYVKIARDITHEVELESQLIQSQKMEAVGRLAGGVAHDFNNLLSVIMGYAELCRVDVEEEDPLFEKLKEIIRASESAAQLTGQLLAFSRKQVLHFEVLDLSKIVKGMQNMLRRLIGEHIRLEIMLAPDLSPIRADRSQLEQIIMNLVVNSRDAIKGDGLITIETASVEAGDTEQRHDEHRYCVALTISDNGSGIDPELASKIFDPFFTTKEKGKGTGLGLSTVHGIVRQHGGSIELQSEPGAGTAFKVRFPCVTEKAKAKAVKKTTKRLAAGRGGETVIVVEDEDVVRRVVCDILKSKGYEVIEAADSLKVEKMAADYGGRIDLLLSDVVMPSMSGTELAATIRKQRPEIKVLLMSGYAEGSIDGNGSASIEEQFIQKPFSVASLLARVREVLDT